ncbi:MAG TPA: FAD-dependent oxidoreductase [Streptosporangiaceae bacterium]|nr:FAD-dependent oxidoreductase [Streptosporangiaceae bacterium]
MRKEQADVVIIGAGPAGLAAATELRRHGPSRVVVLDREASPGGIPRHSHHAGYGLRDLHRVLTGPAYAQHYTQLATGAGAEIRTGTAVTHWESHRVLASTSPDGLAEWHARAVLLATGCRERPRAAELVPGDRPAGVLTTGALQQLAGVHQLPVGRCAVVVGAEHVSFSAVHTLAAHGVTVAAVVTRYPRPQTYRTLQAVTAGRHRVPIFTSTEVSDICGARRVERVTLRNSRSGTTRDIECDTIVFTGDWIPDHELARTAGLDMDHGTRGPCVDQVMRTSQPGVFAAGNLTHPAETADVAALAGRHAAGAITAYLSGESWPTTWTPVACADPLRWIWPPRLSAGTSPPPRGRLIARALSFCGPGHLEITQNGQLLYRERKRRLVPNQSITLQAGWLPRVAPAAGPVSVHWSPG